MASVCDQGDATQLPCKPQEQHNIRVAQLEEMHNAFKNREKKQTPDISSFEMLWYGLKQVKQDVLRIYMN